MVSIYTAIKFMHKTPRTVFANATQGGWKLRLQWLCAPVFPLGTSELSSVTHERNMFIWGQQSHFLERSQIWNTNTKRSPHWGDLPCYRIRALQARQAGCGVVPEPHPDPKIIKSRKSSCRTLLANIYCAWTGAKSQEALGLWVQILFLVSWQFHRGVQI